MTDDKTPSRQSPALDVGDEKPTGRFHRMTAEKRQLQGRRNLAIAGGVLLFMFLIYIISMLRLMQTGS